jgi:hypothetical protein
MKTTAFIKSLLASFVLTACASGPALDAPARGAASPEMWRARTANIIRAQEAPVVDTSAQRAALRRVPHGADRPNYTTSHR